MFDTNMEESHGVSNLWTCVALQSTGNQTPPNRIQQKDQAFVLSALKHFFSILWFGPMGLCKRSKNSLHVSTVALALAHKIMLYGFTSMLLAYDFRRTLIVPIVVFTDNE